MARAKKVAPASLLNDPAVKELLRLMAAHKAPGQEDMLAMFQQIAGLEKQLNSAVEELAAMRRELELARESSVKRGSQHTLKVLEQTVGRLQARLADLKQTVIEGCKKVLAAFKEHGVSALANAVRFFHIRPALESIGLELDKAITHSGKALSVFHSVSKEYHEAGLHLKNVVRAVQGRELLSEPKGPGALARVLEAPLQKEQALFSSMKSRTEGAVKRLENLEQTARPSIHKTMEVLNTQIAKARQGREKSTPTMNHSER